MSIFKSFSNSADKGTDAGKEFVSKSYEHAKLKAFQISALTIGMIAKILLLGGLAFIGFVFLSISAAIALGELFNSSALGYLAVAGIIIVVALLCYLFRKTLDKKVISKMSDVFFN